MLPGEILSNDQMRAADAAAIEAGTPGIDLMERAGRTCAEALQARWPEGRVAVACGPGNNGGDGFVMARLLQEQGRDVSLALLGRTSELRGDAALAASRWTGPVETLDASEVDPSTIYVDALFGTGLSRPLEGEAAALTERVRSLRPRTLAVDLPSGLNGDTGAVPDLFALADITVTFVRPKRVHVLQPSASVCGELIVADIGVSDAIVAALGVDVMANGPELWADKLVWPTADSHKHARGRLAVLTGGVGETGAARLAARAGLRAGAGLATLLTPPSALLVAAAASTAVMTRAVADIPAMTDAMSRMDAAVFGPGAGLTDRTRDFVHHLCAGEAGLVLDADALTLFADAPGDLFGGLTERCVLTPHVGEFERLFPGVLSDAPTRIEAARSAADASGAIIVLKGPDTIIAEPFGRAVVNTHASPFLATAGSGDVLAGVIAGLMAQGVAPFDAACAGVWMHGDTGRRLGPGLIAEDLVEALPKTLGELYAAAHAIQLGSKD